MKTKRIPSVLDESRMMKVDLEKLYEEADMMMRMVIKPMLVPKKTKAAAAAEKAETMISKLETADEKGNDYDRVHMFASNKVVMLDDNRANKAGTKNTKAKVYKDDLARVPRSLLQAIESFVTSRKR